jgi:Holliday junction resolvasome RuvABC endonuclease subunit
VKKFKIAGIDPSLTSLGLTITNEEGVLIEYHKITSVLPKEYMEDRLIDIDTQLLDVLRGHTDIVAVGIEGMSYGSISSSTRTLAQLYGVLTTTIRRELGIRCDTFAPTSVKKFATTNGRAEKIEMVEALPEEVRELFKKDFKKSTGLFDLTDAYWIAQMTLDNYKKGH